MNSLWYGLAMVAIVFVIRWMIQNDALADKETKGVFAMKPPTSAGINAKRAKRKKFSLDDVR